MTGEIGNKYRLPDQENIMKLGRVNWLRVLRRSLFAAVLAGLSQFGYAESEYAAAWGPSIGSTAPMLSALDQDGHQQNLGQIHKVIFDSSALSHIFDIKESLVF